MTPLSLGDPRDPGVHKRQCNGCGQHEGASQKFSLCASCRLVNYCSADCQKAHWKESHKMVCSQLTDEIEAEGKDIVQEMERGNVDVSLLIAYSEMIQCMPWPCGTDS
ncbi:hypothetical protein ACHAXR_001461 [Thalassiosira sp. AJA248-18]